jgi:hypothetical protein
VSFHGSSISAHRLHVHTSQNGVAMDGQPVVGPVGDLPGLFLAVSFHSGGFGHHPAAGFFLAEWIVDGQTSLDISELSPDRFAADARDGFLAKQMTHHEVWEADQSDVYKMRPIIRRH